MMTGAFSLINLSSFSVYNPFNTWWSQWFQQECNGVRVNRGIHGSWVFCKTKLLQGTFLSFCLIPNKTFHSHMMCTQMFELSYYLNVIPIPQCFSYRTVRTWSRFLLMLYRIIHPGCKSWPLPIFCELSLVCIDCAKKGGFPSWLCYGFKYICGYPMSINGVRRFS